MTGADARQRRARPGAPRNGEAATRRGGELDHTGSERCRMCGDGALSGVGVVDGYPFLECGRCGFVFAPSITPARMAALYKNGYHGPEDGAPSQGWADFSFLRPALARLRESWPLRMLDFGTGQSLIPARLREQGHRVVAVDVAPPLRPHPDRLTGDLPELGLPANHFDLSFSFQVVEHLPEPRPALEELLRVTRPGGLVVLHTDMEVDERSAAVRGWWYVMPPDHCVFFRHRTFEVFLQGTPHRIVDREPKSVTIEVGLDPAPSPTRMEA